MDRCRSGTAGGLGGLGGLGALGALLMLAPAPPAGAQEQPVWWARTAYARDEYRSPNPSWSAWETWETSVARRTPRGSLALGAAYTRRSDLHDFGVMALAQHRLWRGAHGTVRLQTGERITARVELGAELFQGFGDGFEASLGARQMRFTNATVRMASISLGRYASPWFARARVGVASQGTLSQGRPGASVLLRRQLDERQGFVEASAGTGTEAVVASRVQTGGLVSVRNTGFFAVGAQKYFTPTFGAQVGANTVTFEGIPRRYGGSVALLARW